jgi:zinc D-Ala-D-Ala carboxypeptidase
LNNGGLPGKPTKFSVSPEDDIPIAVRDTPDDKRRSRLRPVLLSGGLLGIGAIALLIGVSISTPPKPKSTPTSTPQPSATPTTTPKNPDNLLGHLPYKEASASELRSITPGSRILLRANAAKAFQAMSAAAARNGVVLAPISGFRSVADQQQVFFGVKAQRRQGVTQRAEVSAPPGYSEHHTGYAIDLGDSRVPATNLSPMFEQTRAFKWLEQNAASYNFEMSFPKDNPQGVTYEPWHWRFVGDSDSLKTFYTAKNLTRSGSNPATEGSSTPAANPALEAPDMPTFNQTTEDSPTPSTNPTTEFSPTP